MTVRLQSGESTMAKEGGGGSRMVNTWLPRFLPWVTGGCSQRRGPRARVDNPKVCITPVHFISKYPISYFTEGI